MKKYFYLLIISLLFIQCSNDDYNEPSGYFPKKITIESTFVVFSNTKELTLSYKSNNLISRIEFDYSGTVNVSNLEAIYFEYTNNNDISEIRSTSLNGYETVTTFTHDDFGVVTQINYQSEESNLDISTSFNPQSNNYSLDGSTAIFPLNFNFDNNDVIQSVSGTTIDDRNFNYNTQEAGIFKNLRQQPELIMWSEIFTFGSSNVNLNYLSPYKLEGITSQSLNHRIFENFEIDAVGNIVSFTGKVLVGGSESEYTILYENRNL